MTDDESFGAWIRQRRRALGLTQEELARTVAYSVSLLQKLEAGRRRPSRHVVARLKRALEAAPEHLNSAPASPADIGSFGPPAALTRLEGREEDVAAIGRVLLEEGARLLTLTGPPGVGKTRLGIEVARSLEGRFAHGVVYVALAPVASSDLVDVAIAQALRLSGTDSRPPAQQVAAALRLRHLLLLLDNIEHLLPATPGIGILLAACPRLHVLATSRAALRLTGEHVYPVAPLGTPLSPSPAHRRTRPSRTAPEELARYAAVSLFVQRARAARPSFELTAANGEEVAEVCRQLDGLPLALELAAARVRLLSPQTLLQQLDRRLSALATGPGDAPQRQQTLRHAIDWSYHLLTVPQQALLRRLGVFVGGWDLMAAAVVGGVNELEVSELLDALVGHSLVQVRAGPGDEMRFTLLETVREYALEQLGAHGESAASRSAHARHYFELVMAAESDLRWGPRQSSWLTRLDQDIHNLRAMLAWSLEPAGGDNEEGLLDMGLRAGSALSAFWLWRGSLAEGEGWLARLLAISEGAESAAYGAALYGAARLAAFVDPPRAVRCCEHALSIFRKVGDERWIALALHMLARALRNYGATERSVTVSYDALALLQSHDMAVDQVWVLLNLGDCGRDQRDFATAEARYGEALVLGRRLGDVLGAGYALANLGRVGFALGQGDRAILFLEESVGVLESTDAPGGAQGVVESLAYALYARGDIERAEVLFRESLRYWWERGSMFHLPIRLEGLAAIAAARSQGERAARLFGAAVALRETVGLSRSLDHQQSDYERDLGLARATVEEGAFTVAFEAGRGLNVDEAVAIILEA